MTGRIFVPKTLKERFGIDESSVQRQLDTNRLLEIIAYQLQGAQHQVNVSLDEKLDQPVAEIYVQQDGEYKLLESAPGFVAHSEQIEDDFDQVLREIDALHQYVAARVLPRKDEAQVPYMKINLENIRIMHDTDMNSKGNFYTDALCDLTIKPRNADNPTISDAELWRSLRPKCQIPADIAKKWTEATKLGFAYSYTGQDDNHLTPILATYTAVIRMLDELSHRELDEFEAEDGQRAKGIFDRLFLDATLRADHLQKKIINLFIKDHYDNQTGSATFNSVQIPQVYLE